MKIYTKTGDQGMTGLFGGARLSKDDLRIESYGTVDELNSYIGMLISQTDVASDLLTAIQHKLFNIGSVLATDPSKDIDLPGVETSDIEQLEQAIDRMDGDLEPLSAFILPGGSQAVSTAHICRTVCRRAERRVVSLIQRESVDSELVRYLNRLSDFFFVLARYIAHEEGVADVTWSQD